MAERVRVVRHDGRLLAAKAPGPAGAEGLHAEAALLDRARVPGVVELVGVRAGDAPLLLTAWVGPRSLAEVPRPLPPDHAAALCLAVAGTLQRLHRSGVVHGAVGPAHVLLDDHGRPVLCGFGHAGSIGAPVRRPATDHPAGGVPLHAPTDDVSGIGHLLADLLGPVPPRGVRPSTRRIGARWRALRAVADHARASEPDARPSLAALTRSIRRAAPGATLPGHPTPGLDAAPTAKGIPDRPGDGRSRPTGGPAAARRSPALVAALGVVAVGATTYFGLSAMWSGPAERPLDTASAAREAQPRVPTTARAAAAPTTSTSTTTTSTTAPVTRSAPGSTSARVLEHDGRRYAVGAPGDVVVVGPWRCDGVDLPAVLRTGDGTVSVFDAWAVPGGRTTARTVATVTGASSLTAVDDGPGCAVLAVTGPAGPLATFTADDLT